MLDCLKKEILPHSKEYCDEHGEEIYNIMKSLIKDYDNAYRKGLVALRKNPLKAENADYQFFINMVIEGFTAEEIENIALSRFYERNLSGYEAYLYYVFACTAINLANGRSPYTLTIFLLSVINPSASIYRQVYEFEYNSHWGDDFEDLLILLKEGRYEELFSFEPIEDNFSKIIMQLSDRNVMRMLRDTDQQELAIALKFSTKETIAKIFKNLSVRAACMLAEDLQLIDCTEREASCKKQKILSTLMGMEIVSIKINNKD